ncbi:MAG: hypothetical protein ACO3RX_09540, partial [Chthoniobacterales bacterium]
RDAGVFFGQSFNLDHDAGPAPASGAGPKGDLWRGSAAEARKGGGPAGNRKKTAHFPVFIATGAASGDLSPSSHP